MSDDMLYAAMTDRWVSGVFELERDARDYLQQMPEATRAKHVLRQLDDLRYPVYLLEDSQGFRFTTREAAFDYIKGLAPTQDDDDCCLVLYRFDRDYRPQVAGEDEMGRLNHEHVDNEVLGRVRRHGRAGLRLMVR